MTQILVTGGVSIVTSLISSVVTYFITRRKYYSEVDSIQIANMSKSLDFYTKLADDTQKRLDDVLKRNSDLENKIEDLRKNMEDMWKTICVDLTCQLRKHYMTLYGTKSEEGTPQ